MHYLQYFYMRFILGLLLAISIGLTSCTNNDHEVVVNKEFTNEEWARFDYLQGEFIVKDAPEKYDVVMEVVVTDVFPNIYKSYQDKGVLSVNMTISNPDGSGKRSRDYNFKLKDKDVNWKSEKINGYYTFKLPIISEMTFTEEGAYRFKIENKYTKDPLYGIKSLTIKCIN